MSDELEKIVNKIVCDSDGTDGAFINLEAYNLLKPRIKEALRRQTREALEEAAVLVESHDEVTVLSTGRRHLEKKSLNNVNGNAYAEAIRKLKGSL